MRFNIKLTEYNNTATVSIYGDLVGFDDDYVRTPSCATPTEDNNKLIISPFTNEILTPISDEVKTAEEKIEEYKANQESLSKSIQRSKRKILTLIRSMDLSNAYFVTLTFDKSKVDRNNFSVCCSKTRNWLQNQRKRCGADNMAFICVPELHPQKMDAWHMHLIICNWDNIPITDSGHKDTRGRIIYNLDLWRYGFSTAIKIEDDPLTSIKLAKYVTKYFTKESSMIAHNKHRYFASQNIPKPNIKKWYFETEEEQTSILAEIYDKGYTIVSSNHFDGFVNIDFIEMIKKGGNNCNNQIDKLSKDISN